MSTGKILVIEPNDDVRQMLRIYFDVHGYGIFATSTVEEGLQILDTEKPQAVLIAITNDHSSPENEKAFEFAVICRQQSMKVLFLEERVEKMWHHNTLVLDMSDYIPKPLDIEEVRRKVDELLNL
jgi:DNA-binding response OmpR family regulator